MKIDIATIAQGLKTGFGRDTFLKCAPGKGRGEWFLRCTLVLYAFENAPA